MKEVSRKLLLLTLLCFSIAQTGLTEEVLHNSSQILAYFYQLYQKSGYGNDSTECAAWIIRENDGYDLKNWPSYREKFKQVWTRPIPRNAVALAHTHAASNIQKPSSTDVATAKKIKLPIYTISRGGIWIVTADGIVTRLQTFTWYKGLKARMVNSPKESNTNRRLVKIIFADF